MKIIILFVLALLLVGGVSAAKIYVNPEHTYTTSKVTLECDNTGKCCDINGGVCKQLDYVKGQAGARIIIPYDYLNSTDLSKYPGWYDTSVKGLQKYTVRINGLENAIIRVKNDTQRVQLEALLTTIQAKRTAQFAKIQNLTGLEFKSDKDPTIIRAEGKYKVYWLGIIPGKGVYTFKVTTNGTVNRIHQWYEFIRSEPKNTLPQ